jgi:hypothetical protein
MVSSHGFSHRGGAVWMVWRDAAVSGDEGRVHPDCRPL